MGNELKTNELGVLLKQLLKEHSLSMRKLSEITGIDTATISRIISGKRRATPEHLQTLSDCLGIPSADLFTAAGYTINKAKKDHQSDIHASLDSIQSILATSNLYDGTFTIESVEQQLKQYEQELQSEEARNTILKSFKEKIKKVGSGGPFIGELEQMFKHYRLKKGTPADLAVMGSVLMYFIVSLDVIPDYIFPIGYLDDAISVKLALSLLSAKTGS
ncbi:helix-turn-helix domain-containing protein [Domibacillus sp. PGB-M46]|uniref:helix-turn-helix domain-containing protein n=1 Tax=Domibacillus sp. PGB-M46 TaxID=2910255 RepID=UPI001F592D17|nr:helix-turn-helix domain-containing protein [Domibacillus sp. PGB-M46]MCI2255227.1 helix-turn-helix domain-containing protein [Domibacillus sp. PGB-M46]